MNSATAVPSRFCLEWRPICTSTGVLYKVLLVNKRGCCFLGSKPIDCCLLAMFKLLRAERPLHNIPLVWLSLACHVRAPSSWTAFAGYSFGLIVACLPCLSSFELNRLCTIAFARYSFGLAAAPRHGNINFLIALRQYSIFLPPPLSDINFLIASRW
jgi:hypothetical protein